MSYCIFAQIKCNPGKAPAILQHLLTIAEEVRASEPGTVQYQVAQSDEDENHVVIWEEYKDYDSHMLHREGKAFKVFKEELPELGTLSITKFHPKVEFASQA